MAELRLEQLNERDRLYQILNKDHTFSYIGLDNRGVYGKEISYTVKNPFNKMTNEVLRGVLNDSKAITMHIENLKMTIGTNIMPYDWYHATLPEYSRAVGYDAIKNDMRNRLRGFPKSFPYPDVPKPSEYQGQPMRIRIKSEGELELKKNIIRYLELIHLSFHQPKQITITSTFKEKLDQEKLKSQLELETLQAQLGLAQKSLETETLETESAKLDFQQSHTELLTFNKLINKIEELHEPEPVKSGFHLESIDAKKLLVVGLALIGVVILLIVVKNK